MLVYYKTCTSSALPHSLVESHILKVIMALSCEYYQLSLYPTFYAVYQQECRKCKMAVTQMYVPNTQVNFKRAVRYSLEFSSVYQAGRHIPSLLVWREAEMERMTDRLQCCCLLIFHHPTKRMRV